MRFLFYPLAVLAGLVKPLQTACTGGLHTVLSRPFMVGVISAAYIPCDPV